MKITVSYQRKEGRANYGSEGASCEVEFDFDDGRNVHLPPEMRAQSLDHEVAEWWGFCRSEVDRQLAPPPAPMAKTKEKPAVSEAVKHAWRQEIEICETAEDANALMARAKCSMEIAPCLNSFLKSLQDHMGALGVRIGHDGYYPTRPTLTDEQEQTLVKTEGLTVAEQVALNAGLCLAWGCKEKANGGEKGSGYCVIHETH